MKLSAMPLLRLYLIFRPTASPLLFPGQSQLRFSQFIGATHLHLVCWCCMHRKSGCALYHVFIYTNHLRASHAPFEKNVSNTHGPCIIGRWRRSSGSAHRGKIFPQFHLRQSTGSTHMGTLHFSCGQVVVRHDPCAWERRGVPGVGTPRKLVREPEDVRTASA
jgi:hypothetical protein